MSGDLGDVVVSPLSLLLLQLDGDPSDRATLDTLHQVSHIPERQTGNRYCHSITTSRTAYVNHKLTDP